MNKNYINFSMQNMFDEIALVIIELVIPIHKISGEVNFFCSPKASF